MDTAAIVLGLAALGGVVLAGIRITTHQNPPKWIALAHGAIAATGLILLGYEVISHTVPITGQYALGTLVAAALGGFVLFLGFHMRGKVLPIPLVLGHGLIAATGYALLLKSFGTLF